MSFEFQRMNGRRIRTGVPPVKYFSVVRNAAGTSFPPALFAKWRCLQETKAWRISLRNLEDEPGRLTGLVLKAMRTWKGVGIETSVLRHGE
jgi:hypothetical protein